MKRKKIVGVLFLIICFNCLFLGQKEIELLKKQNWSPATENSDSNETSENESNYEGLITDKKVHDPEPEIKEYQIVPDNDTISITERGRGCSQPKVDVWKLYGIF